jgi:hypothetical protein
MTKNAAPKLPSLTKEYEIKAKIRDFANSFLEEKISSVDFKRICEGEFDTKDLSEKKELSELRKTKLQQDILEELRNRNLSPKAFKNCVKLAIFVNDEFLNQVLKKKPKLIKKIEDHGEILNIAVEFKSTETFKILIENGFDPQKKDKNTLSIFALAAQNQGADYLEKYAATLPKKAVETLILEQDKDGKDALSHAIQGRSYAKTIEFLLKNNANIEHRFEENLKTAIIKKHNQTLEILLTKNPKGFAPKDILFLSNFAKTNKNHLAQFFLKDLVEDNPETQKLIEQNIAEIPAYQTNDIHEICREGNLENFTNFANWFGKKQNISKSINVADGKGKTPLFHALNGNCYSDLVENLIDSGANPNFLGNNCEPHEANDALTLCVQKKEPRTLGLILKYHSEKFDSIALLNCAKALCDSENLNALTIESFFKNVKREDLKKIESEDFFEELVKNGINYALEETSKKINIPFINVFRKKSSETYINSSQTSEASETDTISSQTSEKSETDINSSQTSETDETPSSRVSLPILCSTIFGKTRPRL